MLQRLTLLLVILSTAPCRDAKAAEAPPPDGFEAWTEVWDLLRPDWSDRDNEAPGLLSQEDLVALEEYTYGPGGPPNARQIAAFERLDRVAPLMEAAARADVFEPDLRYEDGFMMLIPHLAPMRQSSRLMAALSRRDLAAGDTASAAKWASMMGRMSSQSVQGGPLISALVSSSIYAQSDQAFQRVADSGTLDPTLARAMLEQLDWATTSDDPFGFVSSIEIEGDLMRHQFDRLIEAVRSGDEEELRQVVGMVGGNLGDLMAARGEDLEDAASIMSDLYGQTLEAAQDPDRARGLETIEALEADLRANGESKLAELLLPSFAQTLEARIGIENLLDDRVRLLEGIASGRISPESLANAARLWDRIGGYFEDLPAEVQCAGLELLGSLPADDRVFELLARSNQDPDGPLRAESTSTAGRRDEVLAGIREDPIGPWRSGVRAGIDAIIDLAVDAAAIRGADFPADSNRLTRRLRIHTAELERLRAAGRGLLADATARLRIADELEVAEATAAARVQRDLAASEIVAVIALVGDLLADPAAAHVVMSVDLMSLLGDLLESEEALPLLETAVLRDRIGPALTALPRETAMGVRKAVGADAELFAADWSRGVDSTRLEVEVLESLSRRSPDRTFGILTEAAGFPVRPNGGDPLGTPEPVTPWPLDPEEADGIQERRSLKLLAGFDGIHGPEWVMTRTDRRSELDAIRRGLGDDPRQVKAALSSLEPRNPYPLSASAVLALDRLAALDRLVRDIGRRTD